MATGGMASRGEGATWRRPLPGLPASAVVVTRFDVIEPGQGRGRAIQPAQFSDFAPSRLGGELVTPPSGTGTRLRQASTQARGSPLEEENVDLSGDPEILEVQGYLMREASSESGD
jgi:hypothetical protein